MFYRLRQPVLPIQLMGLVETSLPGLDVQIELLEDILGLMLGVGGPTLGLRHVSRDYMRLVGHHTILPAEVNRFWSVLK